MRRPFGTTSQSQSGIQFRTDLIASSETAIRWSIRSSRNPQKGIPNFIQPRLPAACQVATIGHRATASVDTQIAGVIGSGGGGTSNPPAAHTPLGLVGAGGGRRKVGGGPPGGAR